MWRNLCHERSIPFISEYDVYHDESNVAGYWHGILFVPRRSRRRLLELLAEIRANTDRSDPVSLKSLKKQSGSFHRCVSCWISTGVASLIQGLKAKKYPLPTGRQGRWAEYNYLDEVIGARFILFRVKDGLGPLTLCSDYAAKVEATFRMAFKGGLTLFARQGDQLCVRSLHFDGHEHYNRRLDLRRILRRVGSPPRGVHLGNDIVLSDQPSDHRQQNSRPYDDCQLLQLTDLLVSGFRTVLAQATIDAHRQVCAPLAELVSKWNRGAKGFQNSRWFKGFCISEGFIQNGEWQFGHIQQNAKAEQMTLYAAASRSA